MLERVVCTYTHALHCELVTAVLKLTGKNVFAFMLLQSECECKYKNIIICKM